MLRHTVLAVLALAMAVHGRGDLGEGGGCPTTGDTSVCITPPVTPMTVVRGTSVALALLADKVDAWPSLPGSLLHDPPSFLELLPTTLGDWTLPQGTGVKYTCPDSAKIADVCDAWVFFYTCAQSCSGAFQGGLPGKLMLEGWERNQCAPRFSTGPAGTGFKHPMGALRRQLARGESVQFDLPNDAEFVAFGIDKDGVQCSRHLLQGDCPVAGGRCAWRGGVCELADCRSASVGPGLPCPECPWEGLVSRSPLDGPFHLLGGGGGAGPM